MAVNVLPTMSVMMVAVLCGCGNNRAGTKEKTMAQKNGSGGDATTAAPVTRNHLAGEASPYLLQHADNPVDWYPWGDEALAKAQREKKPIFLSIGYSACHWCHVMERESFENAEIAAILNRAFVSIKVDREERPEIDDIYMRAVQLLTGSGGWPLSVFLTPELKPFYGGTYFPPEGRWGRPGFKDVLLRVESAWKEQRADIAGSAETLTAAVTRTARRQVATGKLDRGIVTHAAQAFLTQFDKQFGGFRGAPKFPPSGALAVLLREHRHAPRAEIVEAVRLTLDRMAAGGMYDQLGGGFHRYSVDDRWLVPHFEKMLYDNALLSKIYLDAYLVTGHADYRRVAVETLDYVRRDLTDVSGALHASEDADSEGEEGRFYMWTPEQVAALVGDRERAALFDDFYDVRPGGNFEGRSILHRPASLPEVAGRHGMTAGAAHTAITAVARKLFAARGARVRPLKDDKVLAAWNGLMISSLACGFQVTGKERFLHSAVAAGEAIRDHMMRQDLLLHAFRHGTAALPGVADDYAAVANAFIDLYETTFDLSWLEAADRLVRALMEHFWDAKDGGVYDTAVGHRHLLIRIKNYRDGAVPSANSLTAMALLRLSQLLGRNDYRERAGQLLRAAATELQRYPRDHTYLLCALDFYLAPPTEAVVIGPRDAPETQDLLAAVRQRYRPNKVVALLAPDAATAERARQLIPLFAGRAAVDGKPTAYICESAVCRLPVTDAAGVGAAMGGVLRPGTP